MMRYEALMLAVPEITQDETKQLESQFESVIKQARGSMVSFERWGKYRLAYPVKKNDYGVYFLARFQGDGANSMITDLQSLFTVKLNDIVMRNMIARLDSTGSLAYQRPHSLEEAPPKEVGGYMRDNNMDGLFTGERRRDHGGRDRDNDGEESSFEEGQV